MKELLFASPLRVHYWQTIFGIQLPETVKSDDVLAVQDITEIREKLLNPLRVPEIAVHELIDMLLRCQGAEKTSLSGCFDEQLLEGTLAPHIEHIAAWWMGLMKHFFINPDPISETYKKAARLEFNPKIERFITGRSMPSVNQRNQQNPRLQDPADGITIPIRLNGEVRGVCSYWENIYEYLQFQLSPAMLESIADSIAREMEGDESLRDLDGDALNDYVCDLLYDIVGEEADFEGNWESSETEYDNYDSDETEITDREIEDQRRQADLVIEAVRANLPVYTED